MLIISAGLKQGKAMSLTKKVQTLNHYIFLLIALFVMFLVLKEFVRNVFHEDYEPPKVQVIDEAVQQLSDISYSKHFLKKIDDVYIFSIKADKIALERNPIESFNSDSASGVFNMFGGDYDDRRVVNFMFAKENMPPVLLFERHQMISKFILFNDSDSHRLTTDKNIYIVIAEDSNKDGYLSEDDQQDVYTSSYDGSDLKLLLSNVSSMHLEDKNLLYLTKGNDIEELTYFYLVDEDRLVQLDTTL